LTAYSLPARYPVFGKRTTIVESRMLPQQSRIREGLAAWNSFLVACLIAALVAFIFYWVEGRDLFGFVYLFSAGAGIASFCILWSLLTFVDVFIVRWKGMKALSEVWTWVAVLALCFGVVLAVKIGLEAFR